MPNVKPNLPSGKGQSDVGQVGEQAKYAKPFEPVDAGVGGGIDGTTNDIGEKSGFDADTSAYIVKKGMVYGEAAKLNIMPPGMDISDQPYRDIRDMPLKKYAGGVDFPGDGGFAQKDMNEGYGPSGSAPGYTAK
jgi:hypothetical protein